MLVAKVNSPNAFYTTLTKGFCAAVIALLPLSFAVQGILPIDSPVKDSSAISCWSSFCSLQSFRARVPDICCEFCGAVSSLCCLLFIPTLPLLSDTHGSVNSGRGRIKPRPSPRFFGVSRQWARSTLSRSPHTPNQRQKKFRRAPRIYNCVSHSAREDSILHTQLPFRDYITPHSE